MLHGLKIMIICTLILICFIYNNQIVISGATKGLMIWYSKVVPILLPSMLICTLIVRNISHKSNKKMAIISTVILGMLCGYPIGAKVCGEYFTSNIYSRQTANLLVPLCNNASPMFIAGYVAAFILRSFVPPFKIFLIIYLPYVIYILIGVIAIKLLNKYKSQNSIENPRSNQAINALVSNSCDPIENSINQITYVGVCIMICSIVIEFIIKLPIFSLLFKSIVPGIIEITSGLIILNSCTLFEAKIKTALIIALCSFGGISSILQTNKLLKQSGLSLFHYIIVKIVCSVASVFLGVLIL